MRGGLVRSGDPPRFALSRGLFLRLLGGVYFVAFASLAPQLPGLIGSDGLLPAADYLERAYDLWGAEAYARLPTLLWVRPGDALLTGLCWLGIALSAAALAGIAPIAVFAALWGLYLSLAVAGQDFLLFQWDLLLLETGVLAVLYAPRGWWPPLETRRPPSAAARWLVWSLAFKLTFLSGVTKLLSGDETWRSLTALRYHYETQPLPTWLGWYAHNAPDWFGAASVGVMFFVRARRAVRRLRTASLPGRPDGRLRAALPAAGADRGHRQLRLLQPAGGGALRLPARRRGHRPRAAPAAGDARNRAARCAPAAGAARGHGGAGHDRGGPERVDVRAGNAPPGADAGLVRGAARGAGPAAFRQRLRPVPRDDDRTAGNRRRGFRRRRDLDRVPVSLESGRSRTGARLRAAAHAASRLADVVRGARSATPRPLAVRPRRRPARERSGRARPAGRQSLPRRAAPLHPSGALPLPVHDARGRSRRGLVGARTDRLPHRAAQRAPPTRNFWRPAISASARRA